MGLTKTESFTEKQNAIARVAKALAHPARVAILEQLLREDMCICGDFVEVLPLSQATVSQHLSELKKAGLIKGSIEKTSMCYCLDKDNWTKALSTMDEIIQPIRNITKCC